MKTKSLMVLGGIAVIAGCATYVAPTKEENVQTIKQSFNARSIAKLDRLDQTEIQAVCSEAQLSGKEVSKSEREALEKKVLATIRYPADGKYLGDFKSGERIAQSGVGLQWSDNEKTVNGGNCYACHQISPQEISYGNIGPSLKGYGKLRGYGEPVVKYTWGKIWNTHAYNLCSQMPRYGDAGILTEAQIKDVMALLLDPESPVNK
ncbi:MAG TPA: sulfur oxidation c-type cytochrome SoxX [Burkholderiaceae bacterium]|nr:sulfur oxidation c-type cytochrome SoxX [Burkholderiaceae bacterium]HQR70710.1 sulfur oxidation c-type cytochrome SoxX [Burkholderiaceae bacterium]